MSQYLAANNIVFHGITVIGCYGNGKNGLTGIIELYRILNIGRYIMLVCRYFFDIVFTKRNIAVKYYMSVFVCRSDFYKSVFRKNRVIVGKNILVSIEAKLNICYFVCVTYVVKVIFSRSLSTVTVAFCLSFVNDTESDTMLSFCPAYESVTYCGILLRVIP